MFEVFFDTKFHILDTLLKWDHRAFSDYKQAE